jgi:hypothetical protein
MQNDSGQSVPDVIVADLRCDRPREPECLVALAHDGRCIAVRQMASIGGCSSVSRLVALLRPRYAGLTVLTPPARPPSWRLLANGQSVTPGQQARRHRWNAEHVKAIATYHAWRVPCDRGS